MKDKTVQRSEHDYFNKKLLLSDPHKWFEQRKMDHERHLEDVITHYQTDFEVAYLTLVDAGIIKEGASITQFFTVPPSTDKETR